VREICMLCLTRRELETWPWWNCEPTTQSKESSWKPFTYRARASSRPYQALLDNSVLERKSRASARALPAGIARQEKICPTGRLNDETTQAMSRTLVGDDQNYEYKGPRFAPCRGPGSSAKSVWSYSDFADLASEPAFAVNAR